MQIHVRDVIVSGTHGCFPHERVNPQRFRVSVDIGLYKIPERDDPEYTVDWNAVRTIIIATVENEAFYLVETMAQHIGAEIQNISEQVGEVIVRIDKLDAWDNGVPSVTHVIASKYE